MDASKHFGGASRDIFGLTDADRQCCVTLLTDNSLGIRCLTWAGTDDVAEGSLICEDGCVKG